MLGEKMFTVNPRFSDITFLHEFYFLNHNSTSKLDGIDHNFINATAAMNRDSTTFLRKLGEGILRIQKGLNWNWGMSETETGPGGYLLDLRMGSMGSISRTSAFSTAPFPCTTGRPPVITHVSIPTCLLITHGSRDLPALLLN